MSTVTPFVDQVKMKSVEKEEEDIEIGGEVKTAVIAHYGSCAICLESIELQETALVKGCEHAYCVNCILQWATYHEHPKCPQCKHPFESLSVHRALDGRPQSSTNPQHALFSLHDYLFEESICLLLRATWFTPLVIDHKDEPDNDDLDDIFYYQYQYQHDYEEEDDDLDIYSYSSPGPRIGNRRWGDNGYIRAGRQEARPAYRPTLQISGASSSSRQPKKKEVNLDEDESPSREAKKGVGKDVIGRRAKRALKREAADKAAMAKHEQHLVRLGRQ